MLVIEDGHSSHMSMEMIGQARANNIHLLCLPAHCTHILQPLDIAVMSLKSHFNKFCRDFLAATPGRVILPENISLLLAEAWPKAVNPMIIFSRFRKSRIFPLNPGEVTDRYTAPAKYMKGLLFLIILMAPLLISSIVQLMTMQIHSLRD